MCIIIGKLQGVENPTKTTLENCGRVNRDGIGVAWTEGNGIIKIKKDFEGVDDFHAWMEANIDQDVHAAMIHFRLSTQGLSDCGNRHPFPITKEKALLRKVELECDLAVAHNGVFRGLGDKKYSDTQEFIVKILADEHVLAGLHSEAMSELVAAYIESSKLMFLHANGKLWMYGKFEKEDGLYYSNGGYKNWSPRYLEHRSGDPEFEYLGDRGKYEPHKIYDTETSEWITKKEMENRRIDREAKKIVDEFERERLADKSKKSEGKVIEGTDFCFACFKQFSLDKLEYVKCNGDGYPASEYICRKCFYQKSYHKFYTIVKDKDEMASLILKEMNRMGGNHGVC